MASLLNRSISGKIIGCFRSKSKLNSSSIWKNENKIGNEINHHQQHQKQSSSSLSLSLNQSNSFSTNFASSNKKKKVIVALSGGVDSSVSAYLLKKQGYEVEGVYMKNWEDAEELGYCPGERDFEDATIISNQLGIKLHRADFVKEYWNDVFLQFIDGIKQGKIPNPDVFCNREIKFKALFNWANEKGMDFFATGHYARTQAPNSPQETWKLRKARDLTKDQTYFLSSINDKVLSQTIFPVGELLKSDDVRKIALEAELKTATKRDSMGICFIGKRSFKDFLGEYVYENPGKFVVVSKYNEKDGSYELMPLDPTKTHRGVHLYCIGERANISGMPQKLFVCGKNLKKNIVYVCTESNHPILFRKSISLETPFWISGTPPPQLFGKNGFECEFRIRHQGKLFSGTVKTVVDEKTNTSKTILECSDSASLRAPTSGQIAVFYDGEYCVGGAVISEPFFEQIGNFQKNGVELSERKQNESLFEFGGKLVL